jgi:hypothetical protein
MRQPKINVSVSAEARDAARDGARRKGVTLSQFVSEAIVNENWRQLRESHRRRVPEGSEAGDRGR